MSKAAKPEAAPPADAPPPKSRKKKMLVIITAVALLMGSGAAAFLLMKPADAPGEGAVAEETHPEVPPKFIELGTFTANLIQEEGDRYLQVAISLKMTRPELEEKIKASNPEILHRVNMVLQSKRPSELLTLEGKEKLSRQIREQVEYVLGLRKTAPVIAEPEASAAAPAEAPASAPAEAHADSGIADVLFTSFLIQ